MPTNIRSLFGERKVNLKQTPRAVTPFGGLYVLVDFLNRSGYREVLSGAMPFALKSPNQIDPSETFTAFLFSVMVGARRFSHANMLRMDVALQKMMGVKRLACDDTIRNFFRRFGMKQVQEFFSKLWGWLLERLPEREEGYSLDLDSTVFERYGWQEGSRKGYNPRKPGRRSHHPLLAVLAEATFVLHGWLRSGNTSSAQGAVSFLREALALLPARIRIRTIRADSGFFDQKLLQFLEENHLPYIVVARMTPWIKQKACCLKQWTRVDENYEVSEFELALHRWDRSRRFFVVRERIREEKDPVGRKLLDVPGYTYRIFVTNRTHEPMILWRDYNQRADMENRIAELKHDLAADDFCMHQFHATETAFRSVLFLFNILSHFQSAAKLPSHRRPTTLRMEIFLCGAILGRSGHHHVIHLSANWGGLVQRNHLHSNILHHPYPTSPKFNPKETHAIPKT